jgi:signal transduction histidine kinase
VIGPGVANVPSVANVEMVIREDFLRGAMLDFTRDFLLVSLLVSAMTGAVMFLVLHRFLVRPVHRLTTAIGAFSEAPEDASRVIAPSGRTDEIGIAEQALARMQTNLAGELRQKRRLAELGLAVSKINHELRNMLTTAQLLGDRLGEIDDPTVRRVAPRLIRTLDRAIEFCGATLAFGRAVERPPRPRPVHLKALVEEVAELTRLSPDITIQLDIEVPDTFVVVADPEQLARVLSNLLRNAVQAFSTGSTADPRVGIAAWREKERVMIRVKDNGPGIPTQLRARIFGAFESSERPDGTGLGLNIADELIRLHGGTLVLEPGTPGASFLICLPDRVA